MNINVQNQSLRAHTPFNMSQSSRVLYLGEVMYAVFTSPETPFLGPYCVFSSLTFQHETTSGHTDADVIASICEHAGFHGQDITFCNLQTHHNYDCASGFYGFNRLTLENSEVSCSVPTECPLEVYLMFRKFIGTFPSLEDSINPHCDKYRHKCATELVNARLEALGYRLYVEEQHKSEIQLGGNRIYSPQAAKNLGYKFNPLLRRHVVCPAYRHDSNSLVVNLTNTHYLGQLGDGFELTVPLQAPAPFSLWYQE